MSQFSINLKINPKIYLKDPQATTLGRKIIQSSITIIDELGFEQFTFGKLARKIKSTEASIYRYFENKHMLFIYLLNWYWEWMKFRIDFNTMNIEDPYQKLKLTLNVIVDTAKRNTSVEFVDEDVLHMIIVSEGTKGYHTKSVDEENKEGFFLAYKTLSLKIAELLLEINPNYPYPRTLASTLIETANNTIYFARHLPRLTDLDAEDPNFYNNIISMLESFAFNALGVNFSRNNGFKTLAKNQNN